jgi:hypothetical protein
MATESWLITALPYSASPADPFHVSLFVTHRLTPDGAEGVVGDFPNVSDWTARLGGASIRLRGGGGPAGQFDIAVTPLLDALDASLWPRVFPESFPVRPWKVPDRTATPWQSFAAHRMQAYGLVSHALALASSPVNAPGVDNNLFVSLVLQGLGMHPRELPLGRVIDGERDHAISKQLDALSNGGQVGGDRQPVRDPVLAMLADLHAARRFYQRTEDATEYQERPVPGTVPPPVTKPKPDFHERAGLLGDLSPLLRKLGLVIDLRVNDLAQLPSAAWIQGDVVIAGVAQPHQQPRTSCQVVGETFTAKSSSSDYELGMLRIGDESRYTVLDLDPDATALKLEQYARQLPRIVAAANNGDPVTTAPATLRATGFALARIDRAEQLHSRLSGAAARDADLLAGTLPPLTQEEISRGVRLEVWDDVSRNWHSLHQRRLTVAVDGAGEVLSQAPDTGFLQGAALTSSDTTPGGPKYAHEVVAGWDGWSLSAPRPGSVVVHQDGDEVVMDAPPADPAPVNPVQSTSEIAPGTLPRLRYGRRYAMRAYAVDLAGNSRPHAVGGAQPQQRQAPTPIAPVRPAVEVRPTGPVAPVPPLVRPPRPDRPDVIVPTRPARPDEPIDPPIGNLAGDRGPLGGLLVSDEDAAAIVARRHATSPMDPLAPPSRATRGAVFSTTALKERLTEIQPEDAAGPDPRKGVAGIDPAGFAATKVPEVDRLIAARVAARISAAATVPLSRAQQVERAFREASRQTSMLLERVDLQTDATLAARALSTTLAGQHGLAGGRAELSPEVVGQLVGRLARVVTTTRPFLRWDALIEPAVVPRFAYTEGESLLRLVIRSNATQTAPGALEVAITPPAEYAAAVLAERPELGLVWRADSQRHVAPPKTSQFEAELHGMLDAAMGPGATPAAVRAALGVSLREAGSFLDTTIADIDNPGQRLPQPGVTFHTTPTAEEPEIQDPADLPDGDQLTPGQYVAHDVNQLVLPYLPDPVARGISLMFPEAGKSHHLAGLFALEGTTLQYLGDWPELVPFRLVLESGPELGAVVEDHVVRVTLPPGEQLRVRLASSIRREALDLMGLWASLPAVIRDNPFLREVAADGWFWWLTPPTEMRFVHAVPRPIEVPRPTILVPVRAPGDTAVVLFGAVDLHGPSTDRIDIEASWSQWVDDVAKPVPERVSGKAAACGTSVAADEDLVVLSAADATVPLPGGGSLRLHAAVHQTGDTLHRHVDYRVRATTRYREYFHPQLTPTPDDLSVVGPVRTLNVPSSARPARVIVRDVLPLFRWHEETEAGHPFSVRRTRKAGLRLYLERPWYSTGDGEYLGVILAAGPDAPVADTVSQWAGDPVFRQQGPAARGVLPLSDLLHLTGLDDRVEPGRPVAPPVQRPLVDREGQPNVWVLAYQPEFSPERGLWFVDVAFDPGTAFWPFVKLAVARYQPDSLPGLHLGPIAVCDHAQLAPERTATLSRTDETHVRIAVTGPVGHPRDQASTAVPLASDFFNHVARSRRMRARLERFDANVATDLGWTVVGQWDLPILGVAGTAFSWAGELPLPEAIAPRTPGTNAEWRVTVEEWELLPADFEHGGTGGWQPRIVYADHLPI